MKKLSIRRLSTKTRALLGLHSVARAGTVFLAEHRIMARLVALKVIRPELVDSPEAVERFRREIRAVARLVHPHIVAA